MTQVVIRQPMTVTKRVYSFHSPGVPGSRAQPQSVKGGGNPFVRKFTRHLPHYFDGLHARAMLMLSRSTFLDSQFGMLATSPVN